MTTITLDDALIDKVIAVSHTQNAQEALTKIIAFYLQQHKQQPGIAELLAMPDAAAIDFEPPRLASNLFNPGLFERNHSHPNPTNRQLMHRKSRSSAGNHICQVTPR